MFLTALVFSTVGLVIQTVVKLKFEASKAAQAVGVFSMFLFFTGFCTFYDVPCWCCRFPCVLHSFIPRTRLTHSPLRDMATAPPR